jgi:hypothetical protein
MRDVDQQPKDSDEQPFSDSTVQCDEWEVKRLTQQMSGYYDDVPTVDVQLDQVPQGAAPAPTQESKTSATNAPNDHAADTPPSGKTSGEQPVRGARAPLVWLSVLALLAALGAYFLALGAY